MAIMDHGHGRPYYVFVALINLMQCIMGKIDSTANKLLINSVRLKQSQGSHLNIIHGTSAVRIFLE